MRPDAIDYGSRVVIELKPNRPKAIARGERQLRKYVDALEKNGFGSDWQVIVETYEL